MPHTLTALETGQLNEWRATLLVRETACLSAADRAAVDEELAPDTGTFDGAGDRRIIAARPGRRVPAGPPLRHPARRHAATERHVSLRPAPDTMCYLTALLPVAQGVAVHAALTRHADTLRNAGDPRTRGQLMADTLVERTTGTPGGISSIEIQLIMTDRTLLQADTEPARLPGYGTVPAHWARELLSTGTTGTTPPAAGRTGTARRHGTPGHGRHGHRGDRPHSGSAGSTPPPAPANSSAWTPAPGSSPPGSAASSRPATTPAAPPTATPPSATWTTSSPGTTAAPTTPQRRRALRSLQPHQRNPRLENPNTHRTRDTFRPAHDRTHHPHRPHLPLHRTTPARNHRCARRRQNRQDQRHGLRRRAMALKRARLLGSLPVVAEMTSAVGV